MRITRRCGVKIRLFSGRRGAAPYDLTYIIRRHGAELRLPSPVGEGGPSETVDEVSLAQMIFVFFSVRRHGAINPSFSGDQTPRKRGERPYERNPKNNRVVR